MEPKVRLKPNVYILLAGILLLALLMQMSRSESLFGSIRNEAVAGGMSGWKPAVPDDDVLRPSGRPYCVAYDGSREESVKIKRQLERTLGYMKKPAQTSDVRQGRLDFAPCAAVIVATENLELLGDPEALGAYAEAGGYVLLAVRPELNHAFYRLYRKMGMIAAEDMKDTQGIELTENVLIGERGLRLHEPFVVNSSIIVELDAKSRVLARSAEGIPLLWEFPFGQGKFMVVNGTLLTEKFNRGLFAGALSMLEPDFIYPIFNSKLFYIDDFPAPIRNGRDEAIYREYRRDIPAFYKEIWWPDMLKAAKRYDVDYTAVFIESYDDRVEPPFGSPSDADRKNLFAFGRELIKSGGELGLHGYNHQSLAFREEVADAYGYVPWPDVDNMAEAVEEAVRFVGETFPDYRMIVYVPPSNVLDPEGREALKKGWPDMAVISSLYGEDASGLAYVQEFEIAEDRILEMPRLTSGYTENAFDRWMMANALTTHGFFSHFIHPDDLFDGQRGGNRSWEQLYREFSAMLRRLDRTYPWLRPMTASQAAVEMEGVLASRADFTREGRTLRGKIEPFRRDQFFILRTARSIERLDGCRAQKIDDGVYLVAAAKADFEITLGD